jgi:3D (Asp-Asp-Asp) domain-containing protein
MIKVILPSLFLVAAFLPEQVKADAKVCPSSKGTRYATPAAPAGGPKPNSGLTFGSPQPAPTPTSLPVPAEAGRTMGVGRLARLTAYWADEGDYYTSRNLSSTGIHLHGGHCAVDPNIIPYGSVVEIEGVGKYLAVDTGSAVVSRTAAKESGHTTAERRALVIDLFFEKERQAEKFAAEGPKFAKISWWIPRSIGTTTPSRSVLADEEESMQKIGAL